MSLQRRLVSDARCDLKIIAAISNCEGIPCSNLVSTSLAETPNLPVEI